MVKAWEAKKTEFVLSSGAVKIRKTLTTMRAATAKLSTILMNKQTVQPQRNRLSSRLIAAAMAITSTLAEGYKND